MQESGEEQLKESGEGQVKEEGEESGILSSIGSSISSSFGSVAGSIGGAIGGIWEGVGGSTPKIDFKFFEEEFGKEVYDKRGEGKSLQEALGESSYVALYFGALQASECPKYQGQLIKTFESIEAKTKKLLVVVYVSCDKAEDHFNDNVSHFPSEWYALKFSDWKKRVDLVNRHHAKTIPHFVLFAPNGDILTEDKKWPVVDKNGDNFPWKGEASSCTLF